jgi:hypothetical protein
VVVEIRIKRLCIKLLENASVTGEFQSRRSYSRVHVIKYSKTRSRCTPRYGTYVFNEVVFEVVQSVLQCRGQVGFLSLQILQFVLRKLVPAKVKTYK